jgi:hypothetical protein
MNGAEVVMSGVVVQVGGPETYGDKNSAVQLPGGVQKIPGGLDSDTVNSSGNAAFPAQNAADYLDELVETETPPQASELTEVPQCDPRALTLGIGLAAQPIVDSRGRPRVLTAEVRKQLCMLVEIGFSRRQAAAYLGFSTSTVANAVERDPALGEELARAEQISDLQPELTVMAEARKNWRAASWYMEFKKRNPRELSKKERDEKHREAVEKNRQSGLEQRTFFQNLSHGADADAEVDAEVIGRKHIRVTTRQKRRSK